MADGISVRFVRQYRSEDAKVITDVDVMLLRFPPVDGVFPDEWDDPAVWVEVRAGLEKQRRQVN